MHVTVSITIRLYIAICIHWVTVKNSSFSTLNFDNFLAFWGLAPGPYWGSAPGPHWGSQILCCLEVFQILATALICMSVCSLMQCTAVFKGCIEG